MAYTRKPHLEQHAQFVGADRLPTVSHNKRQSSPTVACSPLYRRQDEGMLGLYSRSAAGD